MRKGEPCILLWGSWKKCVIKINKTDHQPRLYPTVLPKHLSFRNYIDRSDCLKCIHLITTKPQPRVSDHSVFNMKVIIIYGETWKNKFLPSERTCVSDITLNYSTIVIVIVWKQVTSLIMTSSGPSNQDLKPWTEVALLTTASFSYSFMWAIKTDFLAQFWLVPQLQKWRSH